jgi:hypothetical protein
MNNKNKNNYSIVFLKYASFDRTDESYLFYFHVLSMYTLSKGKNREIEDR